MRIEHLINGKTVAGREGGTWSYEVFLEPKNVAVSLGSHHIPHWGT